MKAEEKIWIVAEAAEAYQGSRCHARDISPWAWAYATRKAALSALRGFVRDAVSNHYVDSYDGSELRDVVNKTVKEIMKGELNGFWEWENGDHCYVWRILECEVMGR